MDFSKLEPKPPVLVHHVEVTLIYDDDGSGADYSARYQFVLLDEDRSPVKDPLSSGDMIDYLTPAEKSTLKSFVDSFVGKVSKRLG